MNFKRLCALIFITSTTSAYALPIDWNGTLGFDTNLIKNARGTTDSCTVTNGSTCVANDNKHARFQTLLLKLNPTIIVNDSTSIKGELSMGSMRGAYLGADSEMANDGSYFSQTSSGNSSLVVNQLYAELYADSALFKVGKFAKHYGLGAIINGGKNSWDRYYSLYNGIEAHFKLGNFKLTPVWAKINSNLTSGSPTPNGKHDATETGVTAMYDNSNKNMKAGVYYAIRDVETTNNLYGSNTGPQNVNIIDVFLEKVWGGFSLALEVPILSGKVGSAYGGSDQSYKSTSYILETSYELSPKWKMGLNGGMIKGSDGDKSAHEALYLHPNYNIAEIMFKYNLQGFQDPTQSVFNASIVNTNYAKFFTRYHNDAWAWNMSFIMAKANQVASSGSQFYDHATRTYNMANTDQKDDLGWELDLSFDYEWNPNIFVTGFLGYYKVGKYYEFTNNASEKISVSDITASGFRLSLNF